MQITLAVRGDIQKGRKTVSKKKLLLAILGGLAALIVVAMAVVEAKVGILFPAPKASLDAIVKPETRIQLVVDPTLAQDFITKLAIKNAKVPPWAIPYVVPYKAALAITPDPVLSKLNMGLMLNAPRLSNPICKNMNASPLAAPASTWFSKPMEVRSRGLLVREGESQLDGEVAAKVKSMWAEPADRTPLTVSGQHAAELLVDLRDGTGMTALLSLIEQFPQASNMDPVAVLDKAKLLTNVASIQTQADLNKEGTLLLHLELVCNPKTDANMVNVIKVMLEMAMGQAKNTVSQNGMELQGKVKIDGKTVNGDFTVSKFGDWLERSMQN